MNLDLNSVKRLLESKTCPEHHERPTVAVRGDSLQISCCCDNFKASLTRIAEQGIADVGQKAVEDEMNKLFKNFR